MVLVQHPFFILLIAFHPVMNQPKIIQRFKYHSVVHDEMQSNDVTGENLGINIFQILSRKSVVVFELVDQYRHCRVYFWFGLKSKLNKKLTAVRFAASIIAEFSNTLDCVTFRVIREIPNHETDDFKNNFRIESLSAPQRRLYMVKGNDNVVIKQVPPYISRYNLNDVFVLYSEKGIHMFIGSGANKKEKKVALKLVQHIKNHDMTDYSSVIDEEEIDWNEICQEGAPEKNKKWLTFISMFHNGKKYFLEEGIPEYHKETDLEFENLRYNYITIKRYNNTDGKTTSIALSSFSISTLLKGKNENTYIVKDSLSLRNAMVYIGKSSEIAIKRALVKAEELNDENYQVKLNRIPSFQTPFIINFTDYEIYLGY